jgi:hypothetical protein
MFFTFSLSYPKIKKTEIIKKIVDAKKLAQLPGLMMPLIEFCGILKINFYFAVQGFLKIYS